MQNDDKDWLRNYARYSTLAFQMAAIILVAVYLGYKIDGWLKINKHIFLLLFSFLSVFLALYYAFRDLLKFK
jgi:hypothetical protein